MKKRKINEVKLQISDDEWSEEHRSGYKNSATKEICIFCKSDLKNGNCEDCSNTEVNGYVRLELRDCQKVADLANLRRDRASKGEKERMDYEYASSSTLAAKKLADEKKSTPNNEKIMKKLQNANSEQIARFIKTGEL